MIDKVTRMKISDFARNATIGSGRDDLEEPDQDALNALKFVLGRAPTGEEIGFLCSEWDSCVQQLAQP